MEIIIFTSLLVLVTALLAKWRAQSSSVLISHLKLYFRTQFISLFSFLLGGGGRRKIIPGIPHLRSPGYFGFAGYSKDVSELAHKCASHNGSSDLGLCTLWLGPIPIVYVETIAGKNAILQESRIGVTNNQSSNIVKYIFNNNRVMSTFLVWRDLNSDVYQIQRRHLLKQYHGKAESWLPLLNSVVRRYLKNVDLREAVNIRDFITGLVLHSSSYLLGLTEWTLDVPFFQAQKFKHVISMVALYGISAAQDPKFESVLYELFLLTLENNYSLIIDTRDNLIRNILDSLSFDGRFEFPDTFQELIKSTPPAILHEAAMNFSAVGLGGMVHSTSNSFDWSLATLLDDPRQYDRLKHIVREHGAQADFTDARTYDKKDGPLFPVAEWILYNVFLYPTFGHEAYINLESYETILGDREITIPKNTVVYFSYLECNRSHSIKAIEEFSERLLRDESTIGRFVLDPRVASFGGSIVNRQNKHTRVCPAAKTSLMEQALILAIILQEYDLKGGDICCDIDREMHPVTSRVNQGWLQSALSERVATPSN